eukprot:6210924-Pleurochrysis_carterae.AAC.1
MRVSRLEQLRKASTVGVIWIAEAVHERAHQYLLGPKVSADQLTHMRQCRQLRLSGLHEKCWPKTNALILLQGSHPHVIVQRVISRMHPLRANAE